MPERSAQTRADRIGVGYRSVHDAGPRRPEATAENVHAPDLAKASPPVDGLAELRGDETDDGASRPVIGEEPFEQGDVVYTSDIDDFARLNHIFPNVVVQRI